MFERDSVCAGDDMLAPNLETVSFTEQPFLSELLGGALVNEFLPCVSGSKTSWTAIVDGTCVAKIEHCCYPVRATEIEFLGQDKLMWADRVFFRADTQERVS